jgi:zinc transport system substrate-binding protein
MAYWASEFAGLEVAGIYGPKPLAPAELADLVAKKPGVIFRNGHVERPEGPSAGRAIADNAKARDVMIINFPGASQDLLDVFRENAKRIIAVLGR